MRLTRKLSLAIALGIVVVLGINGWLRIRAESDVYREDVRRDHATMARGLALAVETAWRQSGPALAEALVSDRNAREAQVSIRFVRAHALESGDAEHEPRDPDAIPGAPGVTRSAVVTDESGSPWMLSYARVDIPERDAAAIEIYETLGPEAAFQRERLVRTLATTLTLIVVCALVTLGFGILFVARPMRELIAKAERIGAGDLEGSLQITQDDEIRDLASAMNTMSERLADARKRLDRESLARLEALDQLRHADRLRTVGELATGIAHELGTPLGVVRARGAMVASGEVSEPRMRALGAIIVEHVDRMSDTIRQLLDFARRKPATRKNGDVVRVVEQAIALVSPLAGERRIELEREGTKRPIELAIDEAQLQHALANLVLNAIHATSDRGLIRVRVERRGLFVEIHVDDDGKGVAPQHAEHVFEPFFTTKPPGEGTGLGLTIAHGIVVEHGGSIVLGTSPLGGARFTVRLPGDPHGSAPVLATRDIGS
jgi:two-component system NtrC family sensor kinase